MAWDTSAAYWVTDEIVYSVDYERGIDILRYKGELDETYRRARRVGADGGRAPPVSKAEPLGAQLAVETVPFEVAAEDGTRAPRPRHVARGGRVRSRRSSSSVPTSTRSSEVRPLTAPPSDAQERVSRCRLRHRSGQHARLGTERRMSAVREQDRLERRRDDRSRRSPINRGATATSG